MEGPPSVRASLFGQKPFLLEVELRNPPLQSATGSVQLTYPRTHRQAAVPCADSTTLYLCPDYVTAMIHRTRRSLQAVRPSSTQYGSFAGTRSSLLRWICKMLSVSVCNFVFQHLFAFRVCVPPSLLSGCVFLRPCCCSETNHPCDLETTYVLKVC